MARYCPSARLLVNDDKVGLLVDRHPEADLREGRAPVGRHLSFFIVEPSHSSWKVQGFFVTPKGGIVMEGSLKLQTEKNVIFLYAKSMSNKTMTG